MFAAVLKYDPAQPRDPKGSPTGGQFTATSVSAAIKAFKATYPVVAKHYARSSHTEMGSIETHTKDVGREWVTQLSPDDLKGISTRFGSDVGRVMTAAIALHDIGKAEAIEEGTGKEASAAHTIPILQDVFRKEGFSEQDVALATELVNHDLIGPLLRGYEGFTSDQAKVVTALTEKAQKVGMNVADFVTLQLAFYQADASAYPYVTQFMRQEPSGKWTFAGNAKLAGIEALTRKRDYVREPAGTPEGGQFAKAPGGFDPKVKATWYRYTDHWHSTPEGERPYGWQTATEGYEVPPITHKKLRMKGAATWGYSHSGSSAMTGEAAKQMGIEGWKTPALSDEAKVVTTHMLADIHADATGAEEPLFHAFENTEGTTFTPGDTMDLPLMAAAGKPETGYGTRSTEESQSGAPTVFAFPVGTHMVAYGMWPIKPGDRDYEEGNAKEFGYVYSEAIVAGRFTVTKVETVYMGSQHKDAGIKHGELTPQLYGQVVHLEPTAYFNPTTGKWDAHG